MAWEKAGSWTSSCNWRVIGQGSKSEYEEVIKSLAGVTCSSVHEYSRKGKKGTSTDCWCYISTSDMINLAKIKSLDWPCSKMYFYFKDVPFVPGLPEEKQDEGPAPKRAKTWPGCTLVGPRSIKLVKPTTMVQPPNQEDGPCYAKSILEIQSDTDGSYMQVPIMFNMDDLKFEL